MSLSDCNDIAGDYVGGAQCEDPGLPCGLLGACCYDLLGVCTDNVNQVDCESAGHRYGGDGSDCTTIDPPCTAEIPAVSEWGVVAMTLLVLTAGTVVFLRRRVAV
jgi:hypothetical protein